MNVLRGSWVYLQGGIEQSKEQNKEEPFAISDSKREVVLQATQTPQEESI
jgi:hypothetical protein